MPLTLDDCRYKGDGTFSLEDYKTSAKMDKAERESYRLMTAENTSKIASLQNRLYAEGKEGVVILFQAMDAAGKDSTIKHVMSGVNPQGCFVHSFKQPSDEELAHTFLWRAMTHVPPRGYIGVFNRSYYEDVLVARVRNLQESYQMPARCTDMDPKEFFEQRYRQIADFEEHLWEEGYRVLKVFLHLSPEEQAKRFLARINDETKNWKFSESDMRERVLWDKYQKAYEQAIGATSTKHAPWYIIPADQKWYARYLVSEAIVQVLESCDPQFPEPPAGQKDTLAGYREQLQSELA